MVGEAKMCFSCSRLIIPNQELVEKSKKDYVECSKFIYASLPPIIIKESLTLDKAYELLETFEKNNLEFLKLHFMRSDENSYRPYNIDTVDMFKYADESDHEDHRLTNLSFLAFYQLRFVTTHLINYFGKILDQKRRRRAQYKLNKKERKLESQV